MRCLGVDYGLRRIGIAISDRTNTIASSYRMVYNKKNVVEEIASILEKDKITHLVVGLPLHMNGDKGEKALAAEAFGLEIQELYPSVELVFEDERLTTVTAQRILIEGDLSRKKRKDKVDALAATLILQKYLDRIK